MCEQERTGWEKRNGEVERSNKRVGRGVSVIRLATPSQAYRVNIHDFVGLHECVLACLLQAHTRLLLILQNANVERERACLLLHF